MSIAGKVFCTLILLQIRDAIESALEKTKQYFALRQVVEKSLEIQLPVKINFLDFKAAFDSVHRESLWKVLRA